jgi:hypothetical protein
MIARDPADRVDKTSHFVELTATTLGVLVLAWYSSNAEESGALANWQRLLDPGGITLGTWINVVESARRGLTANPNDPVARAVRLACENALSGLKTFSPLRNTYAHGGKPRLVKDQQLAAASLATGLSAILDALDPVMSLRLGVVRDCQHQGSSWQVDTDIMIGATEPFRSQRLQSARPYARDEVIAFHGGSLSFALSLAPFCAWAECPACGREELFYLHQRKKKRNYYFSFSTGHERIVAGEKTERARQPALALGMEPIGSSRGATTAGWRAGWTPLASRPRRLAARALDLAVVGVLATVAWIVARAAGLPAWPSTGVAAGLALAYEPVAAVSGGTLGKRLLHLEPVSAWDSRPLGRVDTLRRALFATAQLAFPPLAIRNLAWLLWDPARQCLHDRRAASFVVAAKTAPRHRG